MICIKPMKKVITLFLMSTLLLMGISTTAMATEVETPLTEYGRNGVTYPIYSVDMQELCNPYADQLDRLAKEMFGVETPEISAHQIFDEQISNGLCGFLYNFDDGSKAIYLNGLLSPKMAKMVFVHEMVHYVYNIPESIIYSKDKWGYRYPELMEAITDIIASQKYGEGYERAYSYTVLDKLISEDDFLISLYKNEIKIEDTSEVRESLTFLDFFMRFEALEEEARWELAKLKSIAKAGEILPLFFIKTR